MILFVAVLGGCLRAEEVQIIGPLYFTPTLVGWKICPVATSRDEIRALFQAEHKGQYIGVDEMGIEVNLYTGRYAKVEAVKNLQLQMLSIAKQNDHAVAFHEEAVKISDVEYPAVLAELSSPKEVRRVAFVWIQLPESVVEVGVSCPSERKDGRQLLLAELSIRTPNERPKGTPGKPSPTIPK